MTDIRVAFYLRLLYGGGAERAMVNLANHLAEQGLKVDFVLNKKDGPYLKFVSPEVRIVDLQAPQMLGVIPKLARYLRDERPVALLSALHFTSEVAIGAKYLSGTSTRVVVCEQNNLSLHAQHPTGKRDRFAPIAAKLCYPWADGVVAVSQGVAKDLATTTNLPQQRIRVIHNPIIRPELFEKAKEPADHPWFDPGEPPVILGVGRLVEQKDFPTLIRAFAIVRQTQPARLVILGSGKEREKLNAIVSELGIKNDVAFLGFAQNPYAYMSKASVFVLSSIEEGLPTVLIEAMAVGTPVVSTNCESGPDEILDNGKYGELVPVRDPDAIAQAILKILSGNAKSVDPAWLEQYTLETVTQQYLNIFGIQLPNHHPQKS
ncbi:MAG TPA: glycosyl transferase [Cyanobacteria bacterium UBA11369]|nr:glycosyl transferase [Cyanobacteria bacterium UBA11371]HBE31792.1 glycosyl transferase [Cyanobacteria bacterium UBA11368]HBE50112.1 glycosyl transferase [Cyanobacteria bacterium UBA11369]